jgi:hypothetical protein
MTDENAARVRGILAGGGADRIDWDFLLRSAAENSVLPLLARNLPGAAPGAFSAEQFDRLRKAARASGIQSLKLAAELICVLDLFRANGIAAFPYKGPVLAVQAYGDIALREFEDLDILLAQREMAAASELLGRLNYKPRYPWILSRDADAVLVPGEYSFEDPARGLIVELHTERTLRHFPVAPNFDELAKRLTTVALSGHEIRTFCAEDMLVLLCIHGSKDFWERISWIADVSEFLQSQPALDWDAVQRCAEGFGARRMLSLGLEMAARVVDAPVPPEILTAVRKDKEVQALADEVEERLFSPGAAGKTAGASFAYRRRIVPGRLAGWRYAVRLATAPAEEDWMMVKLPRVLTPLYFALRPLRLLRKYGAMSKASQS